MERWCIGLDLGQTNDYSALSIVSAPQGVREAQHNVPWLQRWPLGTPYPTIVGDTVALVARLAAQHPQALRMLVVDATGVGRPVVDLFTQRHVRLAASLVAATITGGSQASFAPRPGGGQEWHLPKRELVSAMQLLLQSRRVHIAPALPEAATLAAELQNFQVKITAAANDTYGAWREGTHDDLVLATALPCWALLHGRWPQPFRPAVGGERARLDGPPLTDKEMVAPFDGRGATPGDVPIAAFGRGRHGS
jgi:hypothetical protein